jgi:hypothetical protein
VSAAIASRVARADEPPPPDSGSHIIERSIGDRVRDHFARQF